MCVKNSLNKIVNKYIFGTFIYYLIWIIYILVLTFHIYHAVLFKPMPFLTFSSQFCNDLLIFRIKNIVFLAFYKR